MALIPLLAAAAAATAPVPVDGDRALLAAFRKVCANVRSMGKMANAARRAQWTAVPPAAHPALERLVVGGREAALQGEPDAKLGGSQFRQTVGNRTAWLVLSRYEDKDGMWGNGCRVYDFDARGPIAPEVLVQFMGKPQTGIVPLPDGNAKYLWEPGWKSGHSVEAIYVTGTDPVSSKFGLKGLVLTAQAIGGF